SVDQLPFARKTIAVWGGAISRYLWLAIAALPFLSLGHTAVVAFLTLYALSALLSQAGALAWLDWMRDLVEPAVRGRYFAWRNAVTTALTVLAAWFGGRSLDWQQAAG